MHLVTEHAAGGVSPDADAATAQAFGTGLKECLDQAEIVPDLRGAELVPLGARR